MKKKILELMAWFLFETGITSPGNRSSGNFSIVTFHRVLTEENRQNYPFPGLAVTPEELDEFLDYFSKHFDCGSLASQHDRYLTGEKTERPLLAITFDDAQFDNFCNARPVLAKHNIKASFFAPVESVEKQELLWHDRLGFAILDILQRQGGRERLMGILDSAGLSAKGSGSMMSNIVSASKGLSLEARLHFVETLVEESGSAHPPDFARMMTFEELAKLSAEGHEIGSHSMTHAMMTECTDSALKYEIEESRRVLQARLGHPITTFCYPNGNADARTALAVEQAGYLRAATTNWGNNGQDADRFQLRRYDMVAKRVQNSAGKFSPALLAFRMSGFYPGLR